MRIRRLAIRAGIGLLALAAFGAFGGSKAPPGADFLTPCETQAALDLRRLARAQARFQASGLLDRDQDRLGEYGFLSDLVAGGEVHVPYPSSGSYRVCVYLPGRDGEGRTSGRICAERSAACWSAYAWPDPPGPAASRVFFIDQSGQVRLAPIHTVASGRPSWDAACPPGRSAMEPVPWPAWGGWAFLP